MRWLSVLLSAMLWGALPAHNAWYRAGRGAMSEAEPGAVAGHLIVLAGFFLVALLMHWLFAGKVSRLSGWRFWVFPFLSIPVAAVFIALPYAVATPLLDNNLAPHTPVPFLEVWAGCTFNIVIFSMTLLIWISYPFALINQVIIRLIYPRPPRLAGSVEG